MSNTLAELHQECGRIGRRVTDANLPLKMYGKSCAVELQLCGDNGNYWVEVRSSIGYDEQVAIIMQMFENGNSDSIAMAVANKIKQRTIDKACEWLREHLGAPVGMPQAKSYNDAINELTTEFRKGMEE